MCQLRETQNSVGLRPSTSSEKSTKEDVTLFSEVTFSRDGPVFRTRGVGVRRGGSTREESLHDPGSKGEPTDRPTNTLVVDGPR